MATTFDWTPEPTLIERVLELANQSGQSPEAIVNQAVVTYLQAHSPDQPKRSRGQALIEHLRGKATSGLTTDDIMQLTRGEDD